MLSSSVKHFFSDAPISNWRPEETERIRDAETIKMKIDEEDLDSSIAIAMASSFLPSLETLNSFPVSRKKTV